MKDPVQSRAVGATRESVALAAHEVFAAGGYHGVSVRDIAAAVGVNVATVHYHYGTKAALYQAVFDRLSEAEAAALGDQLDKVRAAAAQGSAADLCTALLTLLESYVDFVAAQPSAARLWSQRGLETPAREDPLQQVYGAPLYRALEGALLQAAERGVVRQMDYHLLLKSYIWTVYGFFTGGPLDDTWGGPGSGPARLIGYLRETVERTLFWDDIHPDSLLNRPRA